MESKKNAFRRFEHFSQPLIPRRIFLRRMSRHSLLAFFFLSLSLLAGMIGYHILGRLSWMDSFLNASMILTGMGPVDHFDSNAAKFFSGIYALYSGIAFLTSMGLLFAPLIHRVMHRFHLAKS